MTGHCSQCGAARLPDDRFCRACGASIGDRRSQREEWMRQDRSGTMWAIGGVLMAGVGIVIGAIGCFYLIRAVAGDSLLAMLGMFVIGPLVGLLVALRLWQALWVRG